MSDSKDTQIEVYEAYEPRGSGVARLANDHDRRVHNVRGPDAALAGLLRELGLDLADVEVVELEWRLVPRTTVNRCEMCERRTSPPYFRGRYDRAALRAACAELGVRRPVRVRARRDWERWDPETGSWHNGEYTYDEERGEHLVTLAYGMNVEVTDEAFVHELAHAAQVERDGPAGHALSSAFGEAMFGYEQSPVEVEAREVESRLRGRFRIARPGEAGGRR